jgi:hypothetical protein
MDWPLGGDLEDVPLDGLVELGEVDPNVHHRAVLHLVPMPQVNLKMSEYHMFTNKNIQFM